MIVNDVSVTSPCSTISSGLVAPPHRLALRRPASKKRQGTKSREVWGRLGSERCGDLIIAEAMVEEPDVGASRTGRQGDARSSSAATEAAWSKPVQSSAHVGPWRFSLGLRRPQILVSVRRTLFLVWALRPDTNGHLSSGALVPGVPHRGFRLVERQPELRHRRFQGSSTPWRPCP